MKYVGLLLFATAAFAQVVRPDLSSLSSDERAMVESACSIEHDVGGPAAYYRCLDAKREAARKWRRKPDLSALSAEEQSMVESACSIQHDVGGPASYYQCLTGQLTAMGIRRSPSPSEAVVPVPEPQPPPPVVSAPAYSVAPAVREPTPPVPSGHDNGDWLWGLGFLVTFSLLTARAARRSQPQATSQSKPPVAPQLPTDDPYSVLGLQRTATSSEIRAAYRNLIARYHPDKVAHLGVEFQDLAKAKAADLNRAYKALVR